MTYIIEPDRRKWDHSGSKPIKITCSTCGSDDTRRDAWAEWNIEQQKWVLGEIFDDGACQTCEGSAHLEDTELDDNTFVYKEPI